MQLRKPIDDRLLDEILLQESPHMSDPIADAKLMEAIQKTREEIAHAFAARRGVQVSLSS